MSQLRLFAELIVTKIVTNSGANFFRGTLRLQITYASATSGD
jgi:hypothetical protein